MASSFAFSSKSSLYNLQIQKNKMTFLSPSPLTHNLRFTIHDNPKISKTMKIITAAFKHKPEPIFGDKKKTSFPLALTAEPIKIVQKIELSDKLALVAAFMFLVVPKFPRGLLIKLVCSFAFSAAVFGIDKLQGFCQRQLAINDIQNLVAEVGLGINGDSVPAIAAGYGLDIFDEAIQGQLCDLYSRLLTFIINNVDDKDLMWFERDQRVLMNFKEAICLDDEHALRAHEMFAMKLLLLNGDLGFRFQATRVIALSSYIDGAEVDGTED